MINTCCVTCSVAVIFTNLVRMHDMTYYDVDIVYVTQMLYMTASCIHLSTSTCIYIYITFTVRCGHRWQNN